MVIPLKSKLYRSNAPRYAKRCSCCHRTRRDAGHLFRYGEALGRCISGYFCSLTCLKSFYPNLWS